MSTLLYYWLGIFAVLIFVIGRSPRGGALTLAYFLELSTVHVPGALAFINTDVNIPFRDETLIGFHLTIVGLAMFLAGVLLARWFIKDRPVRAKNTAVHTLLEKRSWPIFVAGILCYFFAVPIAGHIPSLTSLASPIASLLSIGLWLRFYYANHARDRKRLLQTLVILPLLPIATLTTGGFIGFGVGMALSAISFYFIIARRKRWFYLSAPFVILLGLSFFAVYMSARTEIRAVTWQQNSGLVARLSSVTDLATQFQVMDLNSPLLLLAVTERLNQNRLVGLGVERHEAGDTPLLYGATVPLWSLIPRVVWPDKPAVGGSGDLVSEFTGEEFAQGTSVGAGQVLEFYMNFGFWGVIAGFGIFGFLLMWIDLRLMRALSVGDFDRFLIFGLAGLAMVNPIGSLLEILVGTVAAVVTAKILLAMNFFGMKVKKKTPPPESAPAVP